MTVAKETNNPESEKYSIILCLCLSFVGNKALQSVLVTLVASKQEADVARVIEKARRRQTSRTMVDSFEGCTPLLIGEEERGGRFSTLDASHVEDSAIWLGSARWRSLLRV